MTYHHHKVFLGDRMLWVGSVLKLKFLPWDMNQYCHNKVPNIHQELGASEPCFVPWTHPVSANKLETDNHNTWDYIKYHTSQLLSVSPIHFQARYYCFTSRHIHVRLVPRIMTSLAPSAANQIVESMMTSSNGNIFRVTGPLCGEFTGNRWIPHKDQ